MQPRPKKFLTKQKTIHTYSNKYKLYIIQDLDFGNKQEEPVRNESNGDKKVEAVGKNRQQPRSTTYMAKHELTNRQELIEHISHVQRKPDKVFKR